MNAGACDHGCMADVLKEVRVLTPAGDVCDLGVDELDLGYRHSRIADEGLVVLSATFALTRADGEKIRQKMEITSPTAARRSSLLTCPPPGLTFKRPEGHFAGKLHITDAGLRGYQVGGAAVRRSTPASWSTSAAPPRPTSTLSSSTSKPRSSAKFRVRLQPLAGRLSG